MRRYIILLDGYPLRVSAAGAPEPAYTTSRRDLFHDARAMAGATLFPTVRDARNTALRHHRWSQRRGATYGL